MRRKVAIVTGASGSLGEAFVQLMLEEPVDEIWCIARNENKLKALKSEYGEKIITLPMDLSLSSSIEQLKERLGEEQTQVVYLVNNAGVGELFAPAYDLTQEQITTLINVNCTAVATLSVACIPYMEPGSAILNICSQSSFQPVPYINLYASSKAFVRSFSRALNKELKNQQITATAVCPGWIDTDMLVHELNGIKVKYPHIVQAMPVAKKAMQDTKKGKDMSVYGLYVKLMHVLAKLYPQNVVMNTWVRSVRKYFK